MYPISHIEGRTRLKFQNSFELHLFLNKTKNIPGIKELESNEAALTTLIKYDVDSPFDYVLKKMVLKKPAPRITKDDVSAYVAPLITNSVTKAVWLMALFGPTVGFLQFTISSMLVNRYIKARFD